MNINETVDKYLIEALKAGDSVVDNETGASGKIAKVHKDGTVSVKYKFSKSLRKISASELSKI